MRSTSRWARWSTFGGLGLRDDPPVLDGHPHVVRAPDLGGDLAAQRQPHPPVRPRATAPAEPASWTTGQYAMGTLLELQLHGRDAAALAEAGERSVAEVARLESQRQPLFQKVI